MFQAFVYCVLFSNCSLFDAEGNVNIETGGLYGNKESEREQTIIPEASDHTMTRSDYSTRYPYIKANHIYDGYMIQLMVQWVKDVMICIVKDLRPSLRNSTNVYILRDKDFYQIEAYSFQNRGRNYSTITTFFQHPNFNSHFVFNDIQNKLLFITSDYGSNITRVNLNFTPNEVSFHEYRPRTILILDKSNFKLWITEDSGQNWFVVQEYVKAFFWAKDKEAQPQLIIQKQNAIPTNFNNTFSFNIGNIYDTDIFIKGDYTFFAVKTKKESYDLYVSYKLGEKIRCIFDTELELIGYNIADVTGNRALIAVSHTNTLTHLYASENLRGSDGKVRFVLSLDSVLSYFPHSPWKDSWLHHAGEDAFTDVYKVQGVTGIYIATQIAHNPYGNNLGAQHLVSRITFDHGGSWKPLSAPEKDTEGQVLNCAGCSLHLTQRFSRIFPEINYVSILSSKSAPGIIIANGVIGKSLKGHFGVYVSTDAGLTWRQTLRDLYFFNMGNYGGIFTAIKMTDKLHTVLVSTDQGLSWTVTRHNNGYGRFYGLLTEPREDTAIFTMCSWSEYSPAIVELNLRRFFLYNCTEDDYKSWLPSRPSVHGRLVPCILGQRRTFKRRIPHSKCFNGEIFDLPIKEERCECDRLDYECDFNFVKSEDSMECIRNKNIQVNPYQVPTSCKPGETYKRTKGYRKIPGNLCIDRLEKQYHPDIIPCPTNRIQNMLLYAQSERIVRMKLPNGTHETLQIPNLKNVRAIDYDLKNNCVYWADLEGANRLCEDGISPPEILVSSDLVEVDAIALDWISNNLYFVYGGTSLLAKIDLIRTDIKHSGRMRKTILESPDLSKPRGIAVDPKHGYLFWTDWAFEYPSVNRANLDGTNIIQISAVKLPGSTRGPRGIAIDYLDERVYWVNADDYIVSANLDGSSFKKFQIANDFKSQPLTVAVFKDDIFWNDWNSIFVTNKDYGRPIGALIRSVPGLMGLKVIAHMVQESTNPCSNSSLCPYICVGSPLGKRYKCLCPNGMEENDDKCTCPGGVAPNHDHTCSKITNTCSPEHFECINGDCVPNTWKCDGANDCGDNSDELFCSEVTCPPNYFPCVGRCLPYYLRCDYMVDCPDGSDERNCYKENCTTGFFNCDNGKCVSNRSKCDGEDDCKDFSDERNCEKPEPLTCKSDEFKCNDGSILCIPASWRCDYQNDCVDKSDETDCKNYTCTDFQFSCDGRCIDQLWVCDGDKDCMDGFDEQNCLDTVTPSEIPNYQPLNNSINYDGMFTCANRRRISIAYVCDGDDDCEDESDEQNCYSATTTDFPVCANNHFQCASGECIPMSWICDYAKDCINGEDEALCDAATFCDQNDHFKCKIDGSCISNVKVCDGHSDCADGTDEEYCISQFEPVKHSCSEGYFSCDVTSCYPLAQMCDDVINCLDITDENNCGSSERVYQVLQMVVDQAINELSLLFYWQISAPHNVELEFMPSISGVKDGKWSNKTWIENPKYNNNNNSNNKVLYFQEVDDIKRNCVKIQAGYRFDGLEPFTQYNITVYVRVGWYNSKAFPTANYYLATTDEGIPSPPTNLRVQPKSKSKILVSWNKPKQPNGIIQNYKIVRSPLPIEMRLSNRTTAYLLTEDFEPNVNYSFYVIACNNKRHSEKSEVKHFTLRSHTQRVYNEVIAYNNKWHSEKSGVERYTLRNHTQRVYNEFASYQLEVIPYSNERYAVNWEQRNMDDFVREHLYEVLISEGSELNEETALRFYVKKPPFIFKNNYNADMYSVAVRLKAPNGIRSILSEVVQFNSTNQRDMHVTNSNWWIPACLLLGLLGGGLHFKIRKISTGH